ncbi:MAG: aldo/keto reductase [Deltaproteobacteria bacterium]|nr:aldo/keto reductase [Deltaproteobacteria bacterium]
MKTLQLKNTDELPMLGLGTFKTEPGEMQTAIQKALNLGYRHIDCAPVYGNQPEIGEALSASINAGVVSRDQLWITSKLWNDCHAPEDVQPALEITLADLKLDFLDLFLMHWPVAVTKGLFLPESAEDLIPLDELPLIKTWKAMEKLVGKGLCRHIGVSNFSVKKLESLLATAEIKPEVNQIELHPYLQQAEMFEFCKNNNIFLTAYSPLGSPDRPDRLKDEDEPILLQEPIIIALAEKYSVPPAQILISWLIHKGAAVIPKSTNPERMRSNLDAAKVSLTRDDLQQIKNLDRQRRYYKGQAWTLEGSSYTSANLWDD